MFQFYIAYTARIKKSLFKFSHFYCLPIFSNEKKCLLFVDIEFFWDVMLISDRN